MRIASFNVENLFQRARAMNGSTWAAGKDVLKNHAEMNRILGKPAYSDADKKRIVALMKALGIDKKDDGGDWVILRQNRGHLVTRRKNGQLDVVANGRSDWIGWLDLKYEAVDETATRMTARVIHDVGADVMGVVEAENRPSLLRFCNDVLADGGANPYAHVMLIDGNDDRGIDVAIMTRAGYDITGIRSHVDDNDDDGLVFSRDCPVFTLQTAAGNRLIVLVNHLKSKGFGSQQTSDAKRRRQASRIRDIYKALRDDGAKLVAVIGDFNDTPASAPLHPLLGGTDLKDISTHPAFDDGGFPGTFGSAGAGNKIDYILLSPELMAKTTAGGVFRKGAWPGVRPRKWDAYEEIEKPVQAASDHAAVWADIDV
ncbi:endonuclease/exonuclease/phosphatase family protein [Vineibacter terrae]|uniref:endonuclease/exonuclease/phosphatase family protein n=1 Tax=Vineibacter terrae TaxID=2586908 RepID=UPI002E368FF6|nr:endonuclease/exonuclease/phosphatase family protein [Vineibacter terrae]HEX2890796.1 endonuclease/exonuclease/phosphatase family protein [Vineibacter terrae]